MPEAAKVEPPPMSGPLEPLAGRAAAAEQRQWDLTEVALRVLCVMLSVISLGLMVSSEQRGNLSVLGLETPLHSNWFYSDSLEYLVGVSAAAAAAHSLLQLLLIAKKKLLKKGPAVSSWGHAWILFVSDQGNLDCMTEKNRITYRQSSHQAFIARPLHMPCMMSAGSAAAGVTNLNRTGFGTQPLPRFCDHMAISIAFSFLSFLLQATSAVGDVLWLGLASF